MRNRNSLLRPHLNQLELISLSKVTTDVPATEELPATRGGWIALLAEPAADQRLRFARVRAGILETTSTQ